VVRNGVAASAANIDDTWIGADAEQVIGQATGRRTTVLNDADAAGVAEQRFGAAQDRDGVVIVLTLGTGIGSAILIDGRLLPNTELGHLEIDGHDAESRAAASVRESHDLSWHKWAKRLDRYLHHVEDLFSPDLFVLGGGVSKKHDRFVPLLTVDTAVVPATLRNRAGIVGAALRADEA
jgi:polyphosphate glucokinase